MLIVRYPGICGLLFLMLGAISIPCRGSTDSKDSDESAVVFTMHAIREAARAGNVASWEKLVDADCRFVEPNGRITSRDWHVPRRADAGDKKQASIHADVKLSQEEAVVHGDTAILVYRENMIAHAGEQTISTQIRFAETYRRKDGRWQLIFSTETPIQEKVPAEVDRAIYGDYVGEYQMAPELVGKVYRDDDRLMLTSAGWKKAYELLPLGHDTFFVKEMPENEILFVRDTAGKVIAQGAGGNGKGLTGKKIR